MGKTLFVDGDPQQEILGTIVTAVFLNALNNHRHRGLDIDGDGAIDYAVATGSANAYAITLSPALDVYISGMPIIFNANHENTGAATLDVNSLGAKSLKKYGDSALEAGDIKNGQIVVGVYDGTDIQIISDVDDAIDYAVATGSANAYAITLSHALAVYISGMPFIFKANHENTGAATLDVNSLGAKSLKKYGDRDLSAGDIKNGQIIVGVYDGTDIQIISDVDDAIDYAVATGSANAYAITLSHALAVYISGMPIIFKANHENTGAATLDVNSLGAKSLKKYGDRALAAGDIKNGQIVVGVYDGTNIQIISEMSAVPVSAEMLWPTETPPEGWLEENGASLVRATYPALFAAIGTMYGAADGTHFNLPDFRGRVPRIWAHGQATDPDRATRTVPAVTGATITAGDHVGTNQADEFKTHRHGIDVNGAGSGAFQVTAALGTGQLQTAYNGGNETRPINTYRMMIIKAY